MTLNFSHQEHLFNPTMSRPVILLGAGSVGSWTALYLAKAGVSDIEVWDGDTVASHNAPSSLYGPRDVGSYKVSALAQHVVNLAGVQITPRLTMYEGSRLRNATVIACVDTMEARRIAWEAVKDSPTIPLFVDTRTDAAYIEVLAVDPCDEVMQRRYEQLDFNDDEAKPQHCGFHGIGHAAAAAAATVVSNVLRRWTSGGYAWRVRERRDTLTRVQ